MSIAVVNAPCSCGKVVYDTRRQALAQAKRAEKRGSHLKAQLRPYRCESGFWHLTSRSRQSKTHLAETSKDPNAIRDARRRRVERRVAKRQAAKKQAATVTPIVSAPSKRAKPRGPEHTSCTACGRRWLSDLNPLGRRCPRCGTVNSIVIGWADRAREYVRSVAA